VALLLTLGACGGGASDPSEAEIKADLVAAAQEGENGLTEAQAECYADLVIEEVGVEALKDVDIGADDPPEEIQDALATAAVRAQDECDLTSG
jgi:hypothetical protein